MAVRWSRRAVLRGGVLAAPALAACGGAPATASLATTAAPPVITPTVIPEAEASPTAGQPAATATPSVMLPADTPTATPGVRPRATTGPPLTAAPTADYRDPTLPIEWRADDLLARMTLAEKIGQMTQVEKNSISPAEVAAFAIGSVLSGGGGAPASNTPAAWAEMVANFQRAALTTRLGIPLLYGVDAVHGHNNVAGATIFPHNIGLGAANDPVLVERIGRATAVELTATGIRWNFAPVVAAPQDIRWGRTYEGYSEDPAIVARLGAAFIRGLQAGIGAPTSAGGRAALATPKHFIGDGGTRWGTSTTKLEGRQFQIDQGDTQMDEARLRARFLAPYQAAIAAGAHCIMVSYSSWNGVKLHGHRALLTDLLKGELGFDGFLLSDWGAVDQLSGDYAAAVVMAINAGLDMVMVPTDYRGFITALTRAVQQGAVPLARVDDAVRRILRVKLRLGLFEEPIVVAPPRAEFGGAPHRALARAAVRQSLVLLTNQRGAVPLAKTTPRIFVSGAAADDMGRQCGGWTIDWQGKPGPITPGTTVLAGVRQAVGPASRVDYDPAGAFARLTDAQGRPLIADVGIAVVGEEPYAEGFGDSADLRLPEAERAAVARLRARCRTLVVVLIIGRPVMLDGILDTADAVVVAWLPGSEGHGVADVLFGDYPVTGRLPYAWPRTVGQLPLGSVAPAAGCAGPLFPRGHGPTTADPAPPPPACPAS